MAIKRKQSPAQLKNLKPPFKKGQSGNPKGKPKGAISITSIVRKILTENPEEAQKVGKAMVTGAKRGNIGMMSLLVERIDGPMKKKIDLSVYSDAFDEEERAALDDLIRRNSKP